MHFRRTSPLPPAALDSRSSLHHSHTHQHTHPHTNSSFHAGERERSKHVTFALPRKWLTGYLYITGKNGSSLFSGISAHDTCALLREVHAAHQRLKAWLGAQAIQARIGVGKDHPLVVLFVSPLKPRDRLVALTEANVRLGE